jgi:hypothetical protein
MPPTPTVRNLNDLIGTIGASVDPLKAQYDQEIAANATAGDAQIAGLEAKKTKAFGDITQSAQDKGMFFSGFTPDAEATYTADSYLPALASLQQTIAGTRNSLIEKKLGLDQDVFNKAFDTQQQDKAVLDDWNKMTAQQQFDASEADKQRVFTAQQNQMDRSAQASEGAANRAASAASSAKPDVAGIVSKVGSFLDSKKGGDNHVSPATWQAGLQQWVSAGGDPGSFAQTFYGYANTSRDDLANQYGL